MHRIDCPWCGLRDEAEFSYRGDATVVRPGPDGDAAAFHDYVYDRDNPKGWHAEWWQHAGGCRQWLRIERHTVTHEIRAIAPAGDRQP
ncbi:MAG: sarcosine oxidase subunit delta [Thalassobaculales bacterium]